MLKLARRAKGHFMTLIEIRLHLIRCKPGHISKCRPHFCSSSVFCNFCDLVSTSFVSVVLLPGYMSLKPAESAIFCDKLASLLLNLDELMYIIN